MVIAAVGDDRRNDQVPVGNCVPDWPRGPTIADLLAPPAKWAGAFDLVLESITVHAMPLSVRPTAIAHVGQLVAPSGELIVITAVLKDGDPVSGPPWPLSRSEVSSFATQVMRADESFQRYRLLTEIRDSAAEPVEYGPVRGSG